MTKIAISSLKMGQKRAKRTTPCPLLMALTCLSSLGASRWRPCEAQERLRHRLLAKMAEVTIHTTACTIYKALSAAHVGVSRLLCRLTCLTVLLEHWSSSRSSSARTGLTFVVATRKRDAVAILLTYHACPHEEQRRRLLSAAEAPCTFSHNLM